MEIASESSPPKVQMRDIVEEAGPCSSSLGRRSGSTRGWGHPQQEQWLVIDRKVYDMSQFYWWHPEGARLISLYAGQDAPVRTRMGAAYSRRYHCAGQDDMVRTEK
ncbi:unnamed protein product [Caretta caretta]